MSYSFPYLLFFAVLLFLSYRYRYLYCTNSIHPKFSKQRNSIEFLVCFLYLLFFGLRGYLYTDCFQYVDCFESINYYINDISLVNYQFEPLYLVFNYLISLLYDNFFFFQFVWTLIDVVLLHMIIKKECPNYYLLVFALLIPFWSGVQINLFRNAKIILLFFFCLSFIRHKRFLPFVLIMFVFSFMHSTALLFIPFYFVLDKVSHKIWISISIVSVLLYFVGMTSFFDSINFVAKIISSRFETKASAYIESAETAGFSFGFIFRLILMFLILFYYSDLVKINKECTHVALIYLCANMAFSSVLTFRDRFGAMFVLGLVLLLPHIFKLFIHSRYNYLINGLLFLFISAYLYVQTNVPIAEYENLLTGISSYNVRQNIFFQSLMIK